MTTTSALTWSKAATLIGTIAVGGAAVGISRRMLSTKAVDSTATTKKVFGGGPALLSLPLESSCQVNHNTKMLRFRLPDAEAISGNSLTSALLTFSWPQGYYFPVLRPYTPVNSSCEPGFVELMVKQYPGGKSSTHLHSMQPGQHLFFVGAIKGPQWTANRVRHVVLIAGGAGITPCYQLAQGILGNAKDQTAVTLIYGANSDRDILWKSQMEEWQHAFPDRFKVLFTVSEPEENSTLTRGRVTASLLRDALPDLGSKESEVYVCGPPAMETALLGSRSTKGLLEELGYGKEQIHKF